MDIAVGYKRTEAGIIPDDWEIRRFADHFRIYAGGDVPKHSLSQTKSDSHPFPIYANSLQNGGLYGYTGERRASADSLTITARGSLGHAEYRSEAFFPIVRLLVLEPTGKLDARFTAYAVNELVDFAIESTGVPQLTAPQVGKYAVAAPPTISEQKAIAATLSDVDALLGALDRLIAKKRDLKQAAMQQLLTGQTRLPGFSGKWIDATIGDRTAKVGSGITPTGGASVYRQEGRPFIRSQNVGWGTLLLDDVVFINEETHQSFRATEIETGDVFLNITGASIGRSAIADQRINGGNVNQHVCIIRPLPTELDARYLNCFLLSSFGQRQIDSFQAGGNRQGLNFAQIRSFRIKHPPIAEQRAIAEVIADMDAELTALEQRRDKTRLLKQGMMQELLTGRTRLI